MFWNKKELKEIERLRILLVENTAMCNVNTKRMESNVNLILAHLKLKYVPETETKEPAKLVQTVGTWHDDIFRNWIEPYAKAQLDKSQARLGKTSISTKKRGRPKKK